MNAAPVIIEPIAVSISRAAQLLDLSERRMRELVAAGAVVTRYEGTKRLVDVESLRAYFRALPTDRP